MSSIQTPTFPTTNDHWENYLHLQSSDSLYIGSNVCIGKGSHAKMPLPEGHFKIEDLVVNDGTIKIIGCPIQPETGVRSVLSCQNIYVIGDGKIEVENAHLNFRYCIQMTQQQFSKAISGWSPVTNCLSPRTIPQTAFHLHLFTLTSLADSNVHNTLSTILKSALQGDLEFTRLYVAAGLDQDPRGERKTALMLAAQNNQTQAIETLIQAGAKIEQMDSFDNTALHIATKHKRQEAIRCLLSSNASPHAVNIFNNTPIKNVINSGSRTLINLFSEYQVDLSRDKPMQGCLSAETMHAAVNGDTEAMGRLIDRGIDINAVNLSGDTALILAAKYGHLTLVEVLIRNNADLEAKGEKGSAISWAIHEGHAKILDALLKAGATFAELEVDIDEFDAMGQTESHKEVLDVLIQNVIRTEPEILPEFFTIAAKQGKKHLITHLIKAGADPNEPFSGYTPLAHAILHSQLEIVEILQRGNANQPLAIPSSIEDQHLDDETLLFYAAMTGNQKILQTLLSKINLSTTNDRMETPLIYAAKNNQPAIVQMLLAANVNPNIKDAKEQTAIDHAALQGHGEIVKLLVDAEGIENQTLFLSLQRTQHAYAHTRKKPDKQELAAKYAQIKTLLGNAIYRLAPLTSSDPHDSNLIPLEFEDYEFAVHHHKEPTTSPKKSCLKQLNLESPKKMQHWEAEKTLLRIREIEARGESEEENPPEGS